MEARAIRTLEETDRDTAIARENARPGMATDGIAKIGDGKALLWKHSNGKA